jgi:hypothetical protein
MSHHALQKLVVQMLLDDAFVDAIHADADQALAGADLTEAERAQLLRVDRRAWRHDTLRRRRMLRTLVEEFKVSTTVILAETRLLASLEQFFSSSFFHQSIQTRGSLARAFSEFLLDGYQHRHWSAPQIPDLVRLEAAIAACRRRLAREGAYEATELPTTISDRARVRLAPGCDVASFQANIIETIQHVERYLFELGLMPAMALCDDAPRLTDLPAVDSQKKVYLLFSPGASGISITHLDRAAYLVLYETKRAVEIRSLLSRAAAPKATTGAQEILSEWLESGALMIVG